MMLRITAPWLITMMILLMSAVAGRAEDSAEAAEPLIRDPAQPRAIKWQYWLHPIQVQSGEEPRIVGQTPLGARQAFTGYPADPSQPLTRNFWLRESMPTTADHPATATLAFPEAVAAARFVHYYDRMRPAAAWKTVEVQVSADGESWSPLQRFENLAPDYPQVLGIDHPTRAAHYKFIVSALADGATKLMTHEVETWSGAVLGNIEFEPAVPVQGEPLTIIVKVASTETTLSGARLVIQHETGQDAGVEVPLIGAGQVRDVKLTATARNPLVISLVQNGNTIDKRTCLLPMRTGQSKRDAAGNAKHAKLDRACIIPLKDGACQITESDGGLHYIYSSGTQQPTSVTMQCLVAGKPVAIAIDAAGDQWAKATAEVRGARLSITMGTPSEPEAPPQDLPIHCKVTALDPDAAPFSTWADFELQLRVDDPEICFRPHIDWYRAEKGPNHPGLFNAHHSATPMLCVQNGRGALSIVPDTDNLTWGFTPDNAMSLNFIVPLTPDDSATAGVWRPIDMSPQQFTLTLAWNRDWEQAYRHVVSDVVKFEQPRQWAMPVTQMQMLNVRYLLRHEVWSEQWQMVRSHPWYESPGVGMNPHNIYNFYGAVYTLPALQLWNRATDDWQAGWKARKVADWLVNMQRTEGAAAGAWSTVYFDYAKSGQLQFKGFVTTDTTRQHGGDFVGNPWVMSQSTAAAARALLNYWDADGRKDAKYFDSARRGCEWLLANMRADGSWPYACDFNSQQVSPSYGAGQIWCTWALWRMYKTTGDERYKDAAIKSKDFFKTAYIDRHQYNGYWEDIVDNGGAANTANTWEGYEPAIATLVFNEMGDRELALAASLDSAAWTWTRTISTRTYETGYGQTTEQSLCGPSQAQAPMNAIGFMEAYQMTGDPFWNHFAGMMKSINFCADPDQAYGMVATGGWDDPRTGILGPPYECVRPQITTNNSIVPDEFGRQVWADWCTSQFAWLALDWLVREGNVRAPGLVQVSHETMRGTVLGRPGRIKMPEERCDITGIEHYDINWVGYQNDEHYMLLIMNHKEPLTVAVRAHEAHLDCQSKPPRVHVGSAGKFLEVAAEKKGVQTMVAIPEGGTALLVWDRIR